MLPLLTAALETTQLGITISDPAGKILYTNRAEAEMHGYEPDELIGRDIRIFAPEDLWRPLDLEELRVLGSRRRETLNIRRDGTTFPTVLRSDVVLGEEERPIAVVTICEDITKRKEAERLREQLEQQLRQAQKMEAIGQLAGGIAHDFNNLLVVIQGHVELVLETLSEGTQPHGDLLQVQHAADQAASLTRQLLAFSRRQVLQPRSLQINRVIDEVMALLHRVIGETIQVRFLPQESLPRIHADRGQIEQALLNLCVNARDAMPGGGELRIRTSDVSFDDAFRDLHPWARPGHWVRIEVADTGCGMDQDTLSHCLEPFFTTKRVGKGTGLGLATVHGVIQQHKGLLNVESEVDQGSTFTLCLPAEAHQADDRATHTAGAAVGGDETILIAEDDDLVRDLARRVLTRAGYTVISATNGREAVDLFREDPKHIGLVLMDVVMPLLGGADAYEAMRRIDPAVKVLFSSGYSDQLDDPSERFGNRVRAITKPYRPDRLLQEIREILDT